VGCHQGPDQGVGIPVADQAHIFERFHRAGNVAGHIVGTGLGLAGSCGIVQQHGGTLAWRAASNMAVRSPYVCHYQPRPAAWSAWPDRQFRARGTPSVPRALNSRALIDLPIGAQYGVGVWPEEDRMTVERSSQAISRRELLARAGALGLLAAGAGTLSALSAACAPGTGGGSSEEVSLTHFIWVGGGQGVVPREVVPAYEQAHPNVHIELYEGIGYGITSEFRWLLLARSTGWAEQGDHPFVDRASLIVRRNPPTADAVGRHAKFARSHVAAHAVGLATGASTSGYSSP